MSEKKRFETMVFNYETTGRTDFRHGKIKPPVVTVYKRKPACSRVRPLPLKNTHSLVDWKIPNVPFGLFTKAKDVVRTDPRIPQEPYETMTDTELEAVRKTRPRLVMTPAVKLDNAINQSSRIVLSDIYKTSAQVMMQNGVPDATGNSLVSPLTRIPAPSNPITLRKFSPPYVSPEWKMDSVSWDARQIRGFCDATKEFWLSRPQKAGRMSRTAS